MSEEGESTASSSTVKTFNVQVKPYSKKRPIFNQQIFGTPKRQKAARPEKTNSPFLFSSQRALEREIASNSNVEFKENKSGEDGFYNRDGSFHRWNARRTHSRTNIYSQPSSRRQPPKQLKTRVEKDETDVILPPSAKEIFATLERLARPIGNKDHGWMSAREAEKKPIPKPGEAGGPPVGWRTPSKWNKEKVGILKSDQIRLQQLRREASSRELSSAETNSMAKSSEVISTESGASGGGGGKIKMRKTRMHESRAPPPEEIEPLSYNLDTIPKLNTDIPLSLDGPKSCSTPQVKQKRKASEQKTEPEPSSATTRATLPFSACSSSMPPANVRYVKVNASQGVRLFSQPKKKEQSSTESVSTEASGTQSTCSSFSFSQPKKITKLNLDSQESDRKIWTPKKRKGDVIVKINYPGLKPDKIEETEKPKESTEKAPEKPKEKTDFGGEVKSGFGDLLAKQTEKEPDQNASKSGQEPKVDVPKPASDFSSFWKAAPKSDKYTCDICCVSNDKSVPKCPACEAPNPHAPKASTAAPVVSQPEPPKPLVTGGFADLMKKQKAEAASKWTCDICMIQSDASVAKCPACENPNPKAPAVASTPAAGTTAPKFSFGVAQSSAPSEPAAAPIFGAKAAEEDKPTAEKPTFSFGVAKSSETKTPTFSFGAPKKTDADPATPAAAPAATLFGTPKTAASEPTKPTFSFAPQAAAETTASGEKPSFSFAPSSGTPAKGAEFKFGEKKSEEATTAAPTFSFGAAKEATPATAPTSIFAPKKAPSEAPSFSFEKKSSDTPAFAGFGNSAAKEPEKPALSFGEKKNEAPSFSFGGENKSTFNASSNPKPFAFGETKPATEAFSFGGAAANQKPAESKPFSFGATTEQKKADAPAFSFGKSADATAAAPSFSFAPSKPETAKQPGAPSGGLFGQASGAASSSATAGFSFGASTNETPSFASGGESKPFSFASSTSNNNAAAAGSMFGAASSNAPPPAFSFGGNKDNKPTENKPFSFGASQNAAPAQPSFGNASTNNSSAFSFGGSSQPATNQPAPSMFNSKPESGFNFGASSSANTNSGGNMFGGNTQPAQPSFAFGASQNTNSSFSQPNMSFGGSSQPSSQPTFGQTTDQGNSNNMFNVQSNASTPSARRKATAIRRNRRK